MTGTKTITADYSSSAVTGVYLNGSASKCANDGGNDNVGGNPKISGGTTIGARDSGNYFTGKLYGIRVYSGTLTAEERAINYAIDQVRFYGATADVNTLLPAGWDVGFDGFLCRRYANGDTLVSGTTRTDYNVQFDAGATVTLDTLPETGAALTVTGKKVVLGGDVTFELPQGLKNGTYTLVKADEIGGSEGGTSVAVSGVPSGVESKVTVTETEIKVELNVPYAGEPVTARFLDGEFYYFNADGVPTTAPADGMTNTVTILFSSAAEAQALAGVTAEIAKAKAVQLDADVLLTADTDWSAFEFDMGGHTITLSGCNLKVASLLGTGAVTSCGSVIANGDFSANDVASGVVKTNFIPNGWTGTKGVLFKNSADYGYQQRTSGSLWFSIPRGGSSISQTFTVAKAGQYKLEYVASPKTYNGTNPYASWQVKLDGTVKHSVTKRGYGGMWGNVYFDNVLDLTAGTHTISFCSVGGSGETYGYGDVNFRDIDLYPVDNFVNKTCVLEVCVPAGKDTTNEGVVLAGGASLQVKKTGAGTLRMAKANGGFGATNAIAGWESVIVSAGKVVTTSTTTALGTAGARVKVESAGQLEIGGAAGVGDYEISGSGKVSVAEGATYTLDKFLATGTLEVGGTLVQRNSADVAVATLAFAATGSFSDGGTAPANSILVSGKYAPNAATVTGSKTTNPNVRLADGATLDLSLLTDAFDATTTAFAADSTVTVDIGSREIPAGTGVKLASWSAKPDDVRFTLAAGTNPDYTLGAFPDGLYIQIAPTYATIDATNGAWLFFNAADAACSEWEGGVTPYIDVRFSTAAEAAMLATKTAEFANAKAVLLSGNVNLAENADWSAFTFDMNGHVIDLKGKTLRLKQLVGEGTITDSTRQDYELLDSIRSSGTQRIKTGVKVTAETATTAATELEIDFSNDTSDNNRAIFAMDVWASGGFLFTKQLGNFMFYGSPSLNFGAADTSKKYRVKVSGGTVSLTDLTVGTAPVSKNQGVIIGSTVKDTELILFSRNDGSYAGSYTFHRLWVKDGTGTAHTFVPVRQISTGKCGILDLEAYYADSTKGFHGNSGRGDFTAGNVTNTLCAADVQDGPGELYIEVAAGETQVNETVTLMGSLKLVKEGAGAFTAAKPGQIYSGGTEVAEGLLNLPANKMSATGCLGSAAGTVRVVEGAILDLNGNTGFKAYSVVLAGGTLQNGAVYNADANSGTVGRITLEANSSENVANNLAHTELIDLNGHTLTVPIGSGRVYSLEEDGLLTNGTVIITSGGWFRNMSRVLDMRTVDLKITAATRLFYDVKVRNLDLFYTGDYADGNGRFLVYGTYKAGDYHRNCELQDGATLDLGGQTKAWAVEPLSKFTKCTPVAFADGATIKVSFGSRKVQNGQIVAWQTGNAPADSVKFVGDSTVGGHLFRESDGLYFRAGLVIRIR